MGSFDRLLWFNTPLMPVILQRGVRAAYALPVTKPVGILVIIIITRIIIIILAESLLP
jgi:hypothetical protein